MSQYSVFLNEHIDFNGAWVQERIYYKGDLSGVDLANDWRFKAVSKRRKQAVFLGIELRDFHEIIIDWSKEEYQ